MKKYKLEPIQKNVFIFCVEDNYNINKNNAENINNDDHEIVADKNNNNINNDSNSQKSSKLFLVKSWCGVLGIKQNAVEDLRTASPNLKV